MNKYFMESESDDAYDEFISNLQSHVKSTYVDFTEEEIPLSEEIYNSTLKEYPRFLEAEFKTDSGKEAKNITSDQIVCILNDGSVQSVSGEQNKKENKQVNLASKNIDYSNVAYLIKIVSTVIEGATEEDSGLSNSCNIIIYKKENNL